VPKRLGLLIDADPMDRGEHGEVSAQLLGRRHRHSRTFRRWPETNQAPGRDGGRQASGISELVAERKANHLTQAAVAEAMNVSQSVVAEIESARADVRYSTLDRYAEAVSRNRKRLDVVRA
jgi:hypothetical protein